MSARLSQDLKERIVRSVIDEGLSQMETSRRLMVPKSTVHRIIKTFRERGTIEPVEYKRGPAPKLTGEHLEWLRSKVEESPFLSTYELTPLFLEAFPEVSLHRSTILRALHSLGLSPKKSPPSRRKGSAKR